MLSGAKIAEAVTAMPDNVAEGSVTTCHIIIQLHYYLRPRLASSEGIVSLGVRICHAVCVRRISLDGEGNALYPMLSIFTCYTIEFRV